MGTSCSIENLKEKKASFQTKLYNNGVFKVPGLNKTKFDAEYQPGRGIATKVTEVRNRITMRVDVAYKLPKMACPCTSGDQISKVLREIQKIEHPSICRLIEGFDDPGSVYLIYQKVPGITLHQSILQTKHMSERKAAEIGWHLARVIFVCATNDPPLVHGALAPKNVLVTTGGGVVVTDVGLVDLVKPDPVHKLQKDTLCFAPPEVVEPWLRKQEKVDKTGKNLVELAPTERVSKTSAGDVWSMGAILCWLMTGKLPFGAKGLMQSAEKICRAHGEVDKMVHKISSTPAREFIARLLSKDPGKRPASGSLLENPWLSEKRQAELSNKAFHEDVVHNLVTSCNETHCKKFLMRIISEKMSPAQIASIQDTFDQMDANGDGIVTLEELRSFFAKHPEMEEDASNLENVFSGLDLDNSGSISIHEFIAATFDRQGVLLHNVLWDAFKTIDADDNGKLTKKELKRVVKEQAGRLSKEHIGHLMRQLECEVNGEMTFEEFCEFMQDGGRAERNAWCGGMLRKCRPQHVHA